MVRQGGDIELIDTMTLGFRVGLDDDIADFISETTIELASGDGVVLYTDGITEAEKTANEPRILMALAIVLTLNAGVERAKRLLVEFGPAPQASTHSALFGLFWWAIVKSI